MDLVALTALDRKLNWDLNFGSEITWATESALAMRASMSSSASPAQTTPVDGLNKGSSGPPIT
eukprot:957078-Pyramimonas_sp.AAC.1